MKNKKLISTLLLSTSILALVSCGGGNSNQDVDSDGNKIVKIMFHVDSKSAEGIAYKKRIDAFNREYSSQKIKASAQFTARTGGASAYETDLMNKLVEGTLPDIITYDAPYCASYANSGLLYDITSLLSEETKNDFITLSTYDNKVYGLPIQESSAGFYYNVSLFEQAGIDMNEIKSYTAENPWTFDQFKAVCQKLKTANITPVDMRLDATKDETAPYMLYPFIYASGGSFTSADGKTANGYMNSEKSMNGFKFLKELYTEGYTSYSIGATDFFTGKVGMYLSSGWTIPDIDTKFKTTFPDRSSWGILPYPKQEIAASANGSWCFGITNNGNKDKSTAKELLNFLTSVESSKTITDATGMIPARKSVKTNYADGSAEKMLLDQLKYTSITRPSTVGYPTFSTSFNQILNDMKSSDVNEVVNRLTATFQQELDKIR